MLSSENTMSTSESTDSHLLMLSTSEKMPESISSISENEKKISTRSIINDFSEINIIDDSCRQILIDQKAVNFATLNIAVAAAVFATDIKFEHKQVKHLHHDQLSLSSKHWKKMLDHSYKDEFLTAVKKKYMNLEHWDTFCHVSHFTASSKTLLLKWVFIYKFDKNDYLIKFKARICVHKDLQNSAELDIYAAMLAARALHVLMTITAAFDLEAVQWNAVNIFTNSILEKDSIYIDCSKEFEKESKIWLLLHALYRLWISFLLW